MVFSKSERREKEESQELPSKIYGVQFVEVRLGPRTKVHHINEGYEWVSKTRDFAEDPNDEFGKSKFSGLGNVHKAF